MNTLLVPEFSSRESIFEFYKSVSRLEEACIFDFSKVGFATPGGMVLLAMIFRELDERGVIGEIVGEANNSYAVNMGFYKSFGRDFLGCHARGGDRYIPVTVIETHAVEKEAEEYREALGAAIERKSGQLAGVLTQEYSSETYKLLRYTLREIMRNVVEHSQSTSIIVSGQYWPQSGQVELAISDSGMGLKNSLKSNPYLKIHDDYTAIKYALLPGISGKKFDGADLGPKTVWTNSGFGLFMTSQIARKAGEFFIGSGEAYLAVAGSKKSSGAFGLCGATILIKLDVSRLSKVGPLLSVIAKKGEAIAKIIGNTEDIEASVASKVLFD